MRPVYLFRKPEPKVNIQLLTNHIIWSSILIRLFIHTTLSSLQKMSWWIYMKNMPNIMFLTGIDKRIAFVQNIRSPFQNGRKFQYWTSFVFHNQNVIPTLTNLYSKQSSKPPLQYRYIVISKQKFVPLISRFSSRKCRNNIDSE